VATTTKHHPASVCELLKRQIHSNYPFHAVYVVFGASGGIGSALSKRLLAQPGATVVLAGRDEGRLQQLRDSLGGGEA